MLLIVALGKSINIKNMGPMIRYKWFLGILITATLAVAGCSKSSSVDTAPLEQSFKSADAPAKSSADKVVSAIKSSDYAGALTELKTLAGNAKLTPEQQQAVKDVMTSVQKAIAEATSKAAGDAGKAVDDAKKALPLPK
jgi:hypothetical protein